MAGELITDELEDIGGARRVLILYIKDADVWLNRPKPTHTAKKKKKKLCGRFSVVKYHDGELQWPKPNVVWIRPPNAVFQSDNKPTHSCDLLLGGGALSVTLTVHCT